MTRDEVKDLLENIQADYPTWKPEIPLSRLIDRWTERLQFFDADAMQYALMAYGYTDTKGFAPSVGQLINQLSNGIKTESAMEAWSMVYGRMCNSIYHSVDNFNTLPPIIQKCVGSPEVLRQWAISDERNVQVIQANFLKAYNIEVERAKDLVKIPKNVRQLLSATGQRLLAEA